MSVRNVGIVFSPTLNIPAPVFAMFLTEFDAIFSDEPDDDSATPPEMSAAEPLTPEDIRYVDCTVELPLKHGLRDLGPSYLERTSLCWRA